MKTTKKELGAELETIIAGGKTLEAEVQPSKAGRPKSSVEKKQCMFYLPENIVEAIKANSRGNKSYFADEVFRYYFDAHKIEY
jgi:hypothetical protein